MGLGLMNQDQLDPVKILDDKIDLNKLHQPNSEERDIIQHKWDKRQMNRDQIDPVEMLDD